MAKILVVDDNEQLNSLLQDVLETWGHEVLIATEGMKCLEMARQEKPNIVLLDVMLPGLSGYEVCSSLRADPITTHLGIIMMTALADIDSRIHGFAVQADNFLVKPVNYDELNAIINKLLLQEYRLSTTESRPAVVNAISKVIRLFVPQEQPSWDDEIFYCEKLAQSLGWDEETTNKTSITMDAYKTCLLCKDASFKKADLLEALQPLQLSSWLLPLLTYISAPKDSALYRPSLKDKSLERIAALVQLVSQFSIFTVETGGDKELALAMLDRESLHRHYDQEMLRQLQQIIKDEKVLESIK